MREATENWIEETTSEHNALDLTGKSPAEIAGLIKQWREDEDFGFSAACDLLAGIENTLNSGKVIALRPGQFTEDVYILLPRERDTIIAALRVWQQVNTESGRRFYGTNFDFEMLTDIATNGDKRDALDDVEIDILIEDKINI